MTHNNDLNIGLKIFEDDYLRSTNQILQSIELFYKLFNMFEDLGKRIIVLEEKLQLYPDKNNKSNCQ